jgi:hypothetical protein
MLCADAFRSAGQPIQGRAGAVDSRFYIATVRIELSAPAGATVSRSTCLSYGDLNRRELGGNMTPQEGLGKGKNSNRKRFFRPLQSVAR